jgi:hypothetical protein
MPGDPFAGRDPADPMTTARGMAAVKDAVAAARASVREDADGLNAVVYGTDDPRAVVGALSTLLAVVLASGGLRGEAAERVLLTAGAFIADGALDMALRERGGPPGG